MKVYNEGLGDAFPAAPRKFNNQQGRGMTMIDDDDKTTKMDDDDDDGR